MLDLTEERGASMGVGRGWGWEGGGGRARQGTDRD